MDFIKDDLTRLVAPINRHNTAFLDGRTAKNTETAWTTNLPSQISMLWHCCLGHYHHTGVEKFAKQKLVTRLEPELKKTESQEICEPCLAGKMNAKPFKPSKHWASAPLELIHSDIHYVSHATFASFNTGSPS